jgi:phosphoribosylaminoimidazole (AIR) synthetase
MGEILDEYLQQVIGGGDEGSALLAKLTSPTLKNCKYVDVVKEGMNGLAVLNHLPEDYSVIVYSMTGDSSIADLAAYTKSVVHRLVEISKSYGFIPLAFADVVDASKGERKDIEIIGHALKEASDEHNLAVLNGELAILGPRVKGIANINGTMISLVKKSELHKISDSTFLSLGQDKIYFAHFEHKGKPVWINSDGQGTKGEFQERLRCFELGLLDSLAMKLDDTIKYGAEAQVVSDVVEWNGDVNTKSLTHSVLELSKELGLSYILQLEHSTHIEGHSPKAPVFNISGSVVSLIDQERLKNPPKPKEGDYLIAIRGKPNPRSNGITDKRKTMINLFGENYHNTEIGKIFLEYLSAPSIIFYPHFRDLINRNLATSVYHMSGGAYNGKLARPLAKQGLFVKIENLFQPDWRELALGGAMFTSAQVAYAKWPMGNDGFVTTQHPDEVLSYLSGKGLDGRVVGRLEKNAEGKTGVELTAFNGEKIYYPGV